MKTNKVLLYFHFAQVLMNDKDDSELSARQFVDICYAFMKGGYYGNTFLDPIGHTIINQNYIKLGPTTLVT